MGQDEAKDTGEQLGLDKSLSPTQFSCCGTEARQKALLLTTFAGWPMQSYMLTLVMSRTAY